MFRKHPSKFIQPSFEGWIERVPKVSPDGTVILQDLSASDVQEQLLDPDVFNPTSIVESGSFISPGAGDYYEPSDPALVDPSSFVDSLIPDTEPFRSSDHAAID